METEMKVGIFNVCIVRQGETYGRDGVFTHTKPEPLVEFYDSRYTEGFTPKGQFVTRYYAGTLILHDGALSLDLEIPEWSLTSEEFARVKEYVVVNLWGWE
jgi:hypothetical protein